MMLNASCLMWHVFKFSFNFNLNFSKVQRVHRDGVGMLWDAVGCCGMLWDAVVCDGI